MRFISPAEHRQPAFVPTMADDAARFVWMEREYHRITDPRPFINQCAVVRSVGVLAFGVPLDALLSTSKAHAITDARQKIMAFSRIVIIPRCSWAQIGRSFNRHYSTVFHAVHKFGETVEHALEPADDEEIA